MSLTQFAAAAPAKKTTATKETVIVPGISNKLIKLQTIRNEMDNMEAERKALESEIKDIGMKQWCLMYETNKQRPKSFILEGDEGGRMMILPMDKYTSVSEERAADLIKEFGDTYIESTETYSFNAEILNKHMDKIAAAISGLDIPEIEKSQLLFMEKKYSIKKGSIDRFAPGRVAEMTFAFQPIVQLKNA